MSSLLPIAVYGPITELSPKVRTTGALAGATVTVIQNGQAIGTALSQNNGELWVPLTTKPARAGLITATQSNATGTSAPSPVPVPVTDIPVPLPTPVIASDVSTCMSGVFLQGLVPGAHVVAEIGGQVFAKIIADRASLWLDLDLSQPIPSGSTLTVVQGATVNKMPQQSPVATSLPIKPVDMQGRDQLPAPNLALPLKSCQTDLRFLSLIPGGVTIIENEGQQESWPNIAAAFLGYGGLPLIKGKLVARQEMPRCKLRSADASFTVNPPSKPPVAVVTQAICPKVPRLTVSNLVPGGQLYISVWVNLGNGSSEGLPGGGTVGIAYETQEIDLPPELSLTDPRGPVYLWLTQICCNHAGDYKEVTVATSGGPYAPPVITQPVMDCARALVLTGAHPSSMLQAFDADTNQPISDAITAAGDHVLLPLWFPAATGKHIRVHQAGCKADGDSNVVRVQKLPAPLPVPQIQSPIRPGASTIQLKGVLPGARLFILVDGVVRTSLEVWSAAPTVAIPGAPLTEKQTVSAVQALCDQISAWESRGVNVTRGTMKVSVVPGSIPKGGTAKVTVSATDADTGAPVVGSVMLNGTAVASTGQPFNVQAPTNINSLSGIVQSPAAYADAPFSLALTDPKWTLTLLAAPAVQLFNTVYLNTDQVQWVVTPRWNPSLKKTLNIAKMPPNITTSIEFPIPPGSENRVDISMTMSCSTPGGNANGYPVSAGSIGAGSDQRVVAYDHKNKKITWLLHPVYVGDPTTSELALGIQPDFTGITDN